MIPSSFPLLFAATMNVIVYAPISATPRPPHPAVLRSPALTQPLLQLSGAPRRCRKRAPSVSISSLTLLTFRRLPRHRDRPRGGDQQAQRPFCDVSLI